MLSRWLDLRSLIATNGSGCQRMSRRRSTADRQATLQRGTAETPVGVDRPGSAYTRIIVPLEPWQVLMRRYRLRLGTGHLMRTRVPDRGVRAKKSTQT